MNHRQTGDITTNTTTQYRYNTFNQQSSVKTAEHWIQKPVHHITGVTYFYTCRNGSAFPTAVVVTQVINSMAHLVRTGSTYFSLIVTVAIRLDRVV